MNKPTCYEVYRTSSGWHARLDGLDEPILFISREHALKIARAAALDRWLLEGCPSRVTVSDRDGRIEQDVSYDENYGGDPVDDADLETPRSSAAGSVMSAPSSTTKLSMGAVFATA